MVPTEAQVEEAEALKKQGNTAFGKKYCPPPPGGRGAAESPKLVHYLT